MMWTPEIEPISEKVEPPFLGAQMPWFEALNRPGASQVGIARNLLESLPGYFERVPMADRVVGEHPGHYAAGNKDWTLIYTPGQSFRANLAHLGPSPSCSWVCPRAGTRQATQAGDDFCPPTEEDWLLLAQRQNR